MPQQAPFREVETVQLAPDALVFINGDEKLADKDGNIYYVRNDITDVNTSLNIDSVPGTAGFTITIPDHKIQRYSNDKVIDADTKKSILYQALKIMSEVEMYMKGRFPQEKEGGILKYPYYPVFWGIVTSVSESYSDGVHTISVSCADILRWWQITQVNMSPSIVSSPAKNFVEYPQLPKDQKESFTNGKSENVSGTEKTIYANIFTNKNTFDVIAELAKITLRDLAPLKSSLDAAFGTPDKIGAELTQEALEDIMKYWETRLTRIGRNLRIYGVDFVTTTTKDTETGLDIVETSTVIRSDFKDVMPYMLDPQVPPTLETTMKPKLDIANEVKDIIQFEFFMDVNGEIIFKPPFYNLNVIQNNNSIIRDIDIINWSFVQSESEICTRCDVTGNWTNLTNGGQEVLKGVALDDKLAKKYGLRIVDRHVIHLRTKENCLNYALGELNRINANARQGSITIIGRPELRLGYPIFVPSRNAFYYIKGIDHSFSFGGNFQTTLTLTAERRKTDSINEIFRNVGEVSDTKTSTEGNSISDELTKDSSSNFLNMVTNACVPSKRNRKSINEPSFISSTNSIAGSKQGTWQKIDNIDLGRNFDPTVEYQTTNGDGYEIVPFFNYGLGMKLSETSTTKEEMDLDKAVQERIKNASIAKNITPTGTPFIADPNNQALTLDNEDTSMLNLFDKSNLTKAEKAKNMDPGR